MRKIKKVAFCFTFLVFSDLILTSCIGLSDANAMVATSAESPTTTSTTTTTTIASESMTPGVTPNSATVTPGTTAPEATTITTASGNKEESGFKSPVSPLALAAMLIAIILGLIALEWRSRRPRPRDQGVIRSEGPKKTITVSPSSKLIPPLDSNKTTEQIKTAVTVKTTGQPKNPQSVPETAKREQPVLSTSSTPSTVLSPPSALSTGNSEESASVLNAVNVEADQIKINPLVEFPSSIQERVIIQPPQIGEPSSFARHDWWDIDKEWCLVSPLGMSSDVVCDIGTFGSLAIAAVSLRGHKHKVGSEPCQDAFSLRTTRSLSGQNYVIAVLCDGMSSAKHSEYGARRTSQLLAWSLAEMIEDQEEVTEQRVKSVLPGIFESCRQNLIPQKRNQFGAPGILPKEVVESDFFTTVTFMIVPADIGADEIVEAIVGSIGDSAVFVLKNSTSIWEEIATVETNSEMLNPATSAFPATFDTQVSTIRVNTSDLVIATSDGVGNFINVRGNQTLLGTYLAKQWARPVNLPTFINDVGFDLKSADDDRTVIAIWLSRS